MRILVCLSLVAGTALMAHGGGPGPVTIANPNTATASADCKVQIVAPIAISNVFDDKLDFGYIVVADPSKELSINMNPENGNLDTPKNCAPKNNNRSTAAWFHIAKDVEIGWNGVTITVPETVSLTHGATITTKKGSLNECNASIPGASMHTNEKHFYVGGTLNVPARTFGQLTGKLNVTVAYN